MASAQMIKVGVIIGSQRVVRIGPQVARFVLDTIKAHEASASGARKPPIPISFDLIDLKEHNLPLFDEPNIPNQIQSPEDHVHEHTRVWARRITSCDAFVFVSAQRNWGIPAELKNAVDYLFHEWKGKPAMIVTYGGRGGEQCAGHLNTVLGSIGMRVGERVVHMAFPTADFRVKAFKGQELGLDAGGDDAPWAQHRPEIASVWDEVVIDKLVGKGDK